MFTQTILYFSIVTMSIDSEEMGMISRAFLCLIAKIPDIDQNNYAISIPHMPRGFTRASPSLDSLNLLGLKPPVEFGMSD
jgi:hypothetical protein